MQTACVIVAEWDVNMKKNGIKKGTMRIAVCGIIAALSLVFMMMTSLVPIGTYALPCLAGILISCIVVEYGYGWAIGVFCVTAVLSTLLAGEYNHSVAQLLLTRHAVETEQKRQNVINTIDELLRMNIIPVINENDTVTIDELEGNNFGDNDMLSAIVAGLVAADRLIILTDIDGLYDSNPRTNPNAKKLDIIEKINAEIFEMAAGTGSNRGTGGMITKLQAADYATKRGVEVSVINGSNPENLYEVIDGNKIGTKFLPVK